MHDDVPVFSGRTANQSRKTKVKSAEIYLAIDFKLTVFERAEEIHTCDGKDKDEENEDHHGVLNVVICHVERLEHALQVFACFYHAKKPCHSYDSEYSEVERQHRVNSIVDRKN